MLPLARWWFLDGRVAVGLLQPASPVVWGKPLSRPLAHTPTSPAHARDGGQHSGCGGIPSRCPVQTRWARSRLGCPWLHKRAPSEGPLQDDSPNGLCRGLPLQHFSGSHSVGRWGGHALQPVNTVLPTPLTTFSSYQHPRHTASPRSYFTYLFPA